MTILIDIPESFISHLDQQSIEKSAQTALEHQGILAGSDLTIVIVDDPQIQELNREFRQVDAATDVLAFPAGYLDPDTKQTYLGDVIISFSRAKVQADHSNHSVNEEVQLLVIHGVLHLLGHDHKSPEEKEMMWSAQAQILNQRGLNIHLPD